MNEKYDVIVIGAGPGGYPCAIRLGQLGKKVLVIEAKELGGLCLNWGCIPTKALLYAAEMTDNFKKAKKMGFKLDIQGIDIEVLRTWKESVVKRLRSGVGFLFKANNVEWKHGFAKVISEHEVSVEKDDKKEVFQADNIVLATGTEVTSLPGLEFDHKHLIDTDDALELAEVPETLLVIGAGASGLEMGTIYGRMGSKITVVELMEQILPGMESELCGSLHKMLQKNGMSIYTSSQVAGYTIKDNKCHVKIKQQDKEIEEIFDKILVTVGRKPFNTAFKDCGIETDNRGFIKVNEKLQTSIPNIYAIGDIIGNPLLAHKATKQGTTVAELLGGNNKHLVLGTIPSCVFTIPPLCSVGLTEKAAIDKGIKVKIGRSAYRSSGKALSMSEIEGIVKIIGDENGKLLGLHILGAESSSLIGEGILAIDKGMSVADIAESIHPHPTLTEILHEAAENFYGKAIHGVNRE
ncbi:MAG: dihydrolipoyl dehydrogenase [bacterium]